MSGVALGDAATWAGVVVSIGVAVLAWWQAKQGRAEARCSASDSKRSADAAERSAAAAERLAALADAEANKPPWDVESVGRSTYNLVNSGVETAYHVSIESPQVFNSPVTQQQVRPGEAVQFAASRDLSVARITITVHWFRKPDQGGEPMEWRYPLS